MKPRKRSSYGRKTRSSKAVAAAAAAAAANAPDASSEVEASDGKQNPAAQKQQICVDILTSGHVQSFVDFFYLMHRPEPNPDPNRPEAADAEIEVPVDQMIMVRDNLTSAEAARRDGDTGTVYANYSELARSYQEANDAKTGIYFFEKCLEIARLTGDPVGEMHANHNLGLAYQRLNNMDMAIQYHALHRDLVLRGREALANEFNVVNIPLPPRPPRRRRLEFLVRRRSSLCLLGLRVPGLVAPNVNRHGRDRNLRAGGEGFLLEARHLGGLRATLFAQLAQLHIKRHRYRCKFGKLAKIC